MNRVKAEILNSYASDKIMGPAASERSTAAVAALKADPRYRELRRRLAQTAFFERDPWGFAARIGVLAALVVGAYAVLLGAAHGWLRALAIVVAGVALVQCAFIAHEAAHGAISKRPRVVSAIGHLFTTFLVGYSFAYFRRSHELHHYHVNEGTIDPDTISSMFSVDAPSARAKRGLGRWLTRHQVIAMPVLSPLWAFGMKWDGLTYLWRNRRAQWVDCVVIALHAVSWLVLPALVIGWTTALVNYLGWTVVAGLYLKLIVTVNHVGTVYPTAEEARTTSFFEQQVATSRNIRGPAVLDYLFIGLNMQIEHHLFPFVASTRLRAGRAIVRELCREQGLPYREQGYMQAIAEVYRHLARVGRHVEPEAGEPARTERSSRQCTYL